METKEVYQQIFQAFSALSDAQELVAMHSLRSANDLVNHAITKVETTGGAGAAMTDEALEIEKKKRLKIKDEIVQMLTRP